MFNRKSRISFLTTAFLFLILLSVPVHAISQNSMTSEQQKNLIVIPKGWKTFRGQNGLIVFHPIGWQVQDQGNGAFLSFRPEPGGMANALVLVYPIQKIEGHATGVVKNLEQIFPDLFPGVQVFKDRVISQTPNPEVALAEMRYAPKGIPFRGLVMCFKYNNRSVVYAIACSVQTWTRDEPVMKRILRSFFYSSGDVPEHGRKMINASIPEMIHWSDPFEGAFTCPIPKGWTVDGGLKRFSALDTRPEVLATSPDNRILVRIGDSFIPPMELPAQILMNYGIFEGGWYSPDGSNRRLVMQYLPSTYFLKTIYFPQRVGPVSNIREKDFPQLSQQAQFLWSRAGTAVRADTAEMTFDAQTESGHRKGYVFIQTVLAPHQGVPGRGIWYVTRLFGYLAAPGFESTAGAILNQMVLGYKENPAWAAQQSRLAGNVSQIWSNADKEIGDMIHQSYMYRSGSQDRIHAHSIGTIRNQTLIQDPNTGEKFEVPAGSNYFWRIGSGNEFVGTETSDPVYLPNHWIQKMNVVD
jgi:hypothetical protein